MKNKVLIIFKYPHAWNNPVIAKFSNYYETEFLYVSNFKDKNFTEIVQHINNLIIEKEINIVVFDVDYFKFINLFFIQKINCKKKILWTGDDFELHKMNSITASTCDLVLTTCPLSALKYKEKGYEAYLTHGENGKINDHKDKKKEIDVLFFGALTPNRNEILNYISSKGINLKNAGHDEGVTGLPENELIELISKSKIILNLSKTRTDSVSDFSSEKVYKFYYQTKGRIIIAGMNGVLCVSEYSPFQDLLFQEEVPSFFTKEECVKILNQLLTNEELFLKLSNKFTKKIRDMFEDKNSFKLINEAIEKQSNRKVKLIKIPHWYLRIAAKQILLRNIKISNLNKTILQFKLIFEMLKNTNLLIKFLVIFESILNTLWYSITLTVKSKK
tara:strand:- start:807 stop:1970 length:1164 start_codon:yes stop_codon:yes gene_type:complete